MKSLANNVKRARARPSLFWSLVFGMVSPIFQTGDCWWQPPRGEWRHVPGWGQGLTRVPVWVCGPTCFLYVLMTLFHQDTSLQTVSPFFLINMIKSITFIRKIKLKMAFLHISLFYILWMMGRRRSAFANELICDVGNTLGGHKLPAPLCKGKGKGDGVALRPTFLPTI